MSSADYDFTERPEVAELVPPNLGSFLDVGCAKGGFGVALRRRLGDGLRLVGIEPSPMQAALAEAIYDRVVIGTYPEVISKLDGETFECVSFLDVLEHMVDPWSVLAATKAVLDADGVVIASIPSIQYLPVWLRVFRGRWDYADGGTLDRTHLRFFTRTSIVRMFTESGYDVVRIQGVSSFIAPGRRAAFLRPIRGLFGNAQWLQFVVIARRADRLAVTGVSGPS